MMGSVENPRAWSSSKLSSENCLEGTTCLYTEIFGQPFQFLTKIAISWEINVTNTTIFLQIITAPTLQNWFSITWWYFNLETKPVIQRCEFYSSQYWEENMCTWLSALFPLTVLQKMFFFTAFFSYCYWLISYHTHWRERFLNLQLRTVIYNSNILKRKLLWNDSSE